MEFLQSFLQSLLPFLADNPAVRQLQFFLVLLGAVIIFLVFYTTRDMLLRSNSFAYIFACIILVAVLPIVGFLIYLLIRPARTIKERETEAMLRKLTNQKSPGHIAQVKEAHKEHAKKEEHKKKS